MKLLLTGQCCLGLDSCNPEDKSAHDSISLIHFSFYQSFSESVLAESAEFMEADLQASSVLEVLLACHRNTLAQRILRVRLDTACLQGQDVEDGHVAAAMRYQFGYCFVIVGLSRPSVYVFLLLDQLPVLC